jgi:hypothetical protein
MADTSLIALFEPILGLFNLSKNGIKPMPDRPSYLNPSQGRSLSPVPRDSELAHFLFKQATAYYSTLRLGAETIEH